MYRYVNSAPSNSRRGAPAIEDREGVHLGARLKICLKERLRQQWLRLVGSHNLSPCHPRGGDHRTIWISRDSEAVTQAGSLSRLALTISHAARTLELPILMSLRSSPTAAPDRARTGYRPSPLDRPWTKATASRVAW